MLGTHPEYNLVNLDSLTYAGNLNNLKDCDTSSRYTFVRGISAIVRSSVP